MCISVRSILAQGLYFPIGPHIPCRHDQVKFLLTDSVTKGRKVRRLFNALNTLPGCGKHHDQSNSGRKGLFGSWVAASWGKLRQEPRRNTTYICLFLLACSAAFLIQPRIVCFWMVLPTMSLPFFHQLANNRDPQTCPHGSLVKTFPQPRFPLTR